MTEYTKSPELMGSVERMAEQTLRALDVRPPENFRFVVYDKNNGIDGLSELSRRTAERTGIENFSQHDSAVFQDQFAFTGGMVR